MSTSPPDATTTPLECSVRARRIDSHGSLALCKSTEIVLDTDLAGRADALNPAELRLAALAACMLKGIERVTPILKFSLRGVEGRVRGVRQDSPPKMARIDYEILVDTDEPDRRLALLHDNVRKFGTVFNTVAPGTELVGVLRRASADPATSQETRHDPARSRHLQPRPHRDRHLRRDAQGHARASARRRRGARDAAARGPIRRQG